MLSKEWVKQVNKQIKGSGYKLIRFTTYNEALIWNAFEIMVIIAFLVVVLFIINPIIGAFAHLAGFFVIMAILAKVIASLDWRNRNCWYKPEPPKKEKSWLDDIS